MRMFKDESGRQWLVAVNCGTIRRVKASLGGLYLPSLLDDGLKPLGELIEDPLRLADVLWVLCASQAKEQGISYEAFNEALAGDVLEAAANAFLEAFADFSRDPRRRAALRHFLEKSAMLRHKLIDRGVKILNEIDLDAEADRLAKSWSGGSGRRPESSTSTPTPSPSANS